MFKIVADAFLCSSKSPTHTLFFFTLSIECPTGAAEKKKETRKRKRHPEVRLCPGRWSRQVTSLDKKSKKGQKNGGHSRANPMYTLSVFITDALDKEGKPKWRFSWSPTGAATLLLPVNLGEGWAQNKKNVAGKQRAQPFSRA